VKKHDNLIPFCVYRVFIFMYCLIDAKFVRKKWRISFWKCEISGKI